MRNMQPGKNGEASPIYDLFISHASEDKDTVARPLEEALSARGVKVWCDKKDLLIGESMASNINERIRSSRSAVTVLTQAYFENKWKSHELNALVYLSMSTGRKLYPVWHNCVSDDCGRYGLFFSVVAGLDTGEHCIDDIADEICQAVSHEGA